MNVWSFATRGFRFDPIWVTVPTMTQVAPSPSTPEGTSFASVLAEQTFGHDFARGMRKPPQSDKVPHREKDLLEDDIATISYEQALRTHARSTATWIQHSTDSLEDHNAAVGRVVTLTSQEPSPLRIHEISLKSGQRERRSASITIRLSSSECEQIHTRAEEAGLTVSAYLRSCVLEAEDLRAQVKKMITEMRTAQESSGAHNESAMPSPRSSRWQQFLARLLRIKRTARA